MFNVLKTVAYVLIIVGAINWGFIGWLNINPVESLLGGFPILVRAIYALVGFSALVSIVTVLRKPE